MKVKRILLLNLFLIFIVLCKAQSIDVLDEKNGYKIFKLNSDKSNYLKNLSQSNEDNDYITFNYVDGFEYEIVNEDKYVSRKSSISNLCRKWSVSNIKLKSLNPDIKMKGEMVKKNQIIVVPVKKISKTFNVDKNLFDLFDNHVKSINLTFDKSHNRLKKITLNIDETHPVNYLTLLGFRLKKFYNKFEEIIGPTTSFSKHTSDCYEYQNQSCLFFEDRVIDGKILWKSKNVVLLIEHKAETKFNNNGTVKLIVNKTVSFYDKIYFNTIINNGF